MSTPALAGRGAVVTGGGRGIGAAVARALAEAGAAVVVAARTPNQIERVADELLRRGAKAWAIACDVSDEASVARLGAEARARFGQVDVLVNNAGDSASAPLAKIALAEWQRMLAVNATGTFLCTRELLPDMVARGWGRVVNVASVAGLEGGKYIAHYAAAKHAVVGFTRSVALEVAGTGVTVDALCPGYVDTPMTARNLGNIQARAGLGPEQALAAVLRSTGQERLVAPEEVAEAVVALCAAEGPRVSGRAIPLGFGSGFRLVNPGALAAPRGFSHGVLAPRDGRLLFVAGQAGWDDGAAGEPDGFVEQFGRALDRALAVVREAGGGPTDVARLTVYVTDLAEYRASRKALGEAWRARFGAYYPAMALVEVRGLADRGARVEIEATAVVPHP